MREGRPDGSADRFTCSVVLVTPVAFPFVPVFLVLFLAYMVYSEWARLDSRYPIAAALGLLVVTAVVDASGAVGVANTLAEFVFFLLAGGVVLLLVDHVREGRATPTTADDSGLRPRPTEAADPAKEREGPPHETLDRPEQELVPLVDAPGEENDHDEQPDDRESDHG